MKSQQRYLQIAQTLKAQIREGLFPQGECLPSQKELAITFNTSVMTIRSAIAELHKEGILNIIHGVGTFVGTNVVNANALGLQGFQNELARPIKSFVVEKRYGLQRPDLEQIFGNGANQFSCLVRLRELHDVPVILQRSYVLDAYREIIERYEATQSLYQFFSAESGILITQGKEILTPIMLEGEEKESLQLEGVHMAFLSKRISISIDEQVVLYDEAFLPGDFTFMAAKKTGRSSVFKYIINNNDSNGIDATQSFLNDDLWDGFV